MSSDLSQKHVSLVFDSVYAEKFDDDAGLDVERGFPGMGMLKIRCFPRKGPVPDLQPSNSISRCGARQGEVCWIGKCLTSRGFGIWGGETQRGCFCSSQMPARGNIQASEWTVPYMAASINNIHEI